MHKIMMKMKEMSNLALLREEKILNFNKILIEQNHEYYIINFW